MTDPNDPPRLSDRPSSRLGSLMRGAQGDVPTQPELAALSLRLGATLGAGAAVAAVGKSTGLFAKIGVGAVLAAGAVGLWVAQAQRAPEPSAAVTAAPQKPAPPPALVAPPPPAPEPAAEPSAPAAEPSDVEGPTSAPLKPAAPKLDEAGLLERARRELRANPSAALAISNEHLQRFPGGALAEEREVIAIKALRKLGRSAEADRRAAAFAARYPDSAHKRSVSSDSP